MSTLSLLLTPRVPSLSRIIETSKQIIQKWATPTNLALIGWSVIATTTGSVALLSIMIVVRGYIASRSLGRQIDTARAEYRDTRSLSRLRVAAIGLTTCWLVGAILSLPETGFAAVIPTTTITPLIADVATITPVSLTPADISADILADHPGQQYITLEQMVRRVEGLRAGVLLDNTASIANISVHEALYDKESPIRQILEARGHAINVLGLDKIARGLSREEIEAVMQDYINQTIPQAWGVTEAPAISQSPILQDQSIPLSSPVVVPTTTPLSPSTVHGLTTLGVAIGAWAIGYALGRAHGTKASSPQVVNAVSQQSTPAQAPVHIVPSPSLNTPPAYADSPTIQEVNTPNSIEVPPIEAPVINQIADSSRVVLESTEMANTSPDNDSNSENTAPYTLTPAQTTIQTRSHDIFVEVFWWQAEESKSISYPEYAVSVHSGDTFGGSFESYTKYTPSGVEFTFLWYDGNAARKHVSRSYSNLDHLMCEEDGELILKKELHSLYIEMLEMREALKQEDMQHITSVSIPVRLLSQMYHHADQEEVRHTEILGYWLSSMYLVQDWNLPVLSLNNPWLDEQKVTWGNCKLREINLATKYNFIVPRVLIQEYFPTKEAKILISERERRLDIEGKVTFSGAMTSENWHKHPSGTLRPSGGNGDISEAVNDINVQYPGRRSYLYTILVKQTWQSLNPDISVVKLNSSKYWWRDNYEFRSFIMEYPERWATPIVRQLQIHIT